MTADLVVANGWVITPTAVMFGGVAVEGERILHVAPSAELPSSRRVIDADGRVIMPGFIDPHVHMTSEEDSSVLEGLAENLPTESRGMVAGGVTTFGHFAGSVGEALVPSLRETIEGLNRFSYVDSFVHAYVLDRSSMDFLGEVWDLGITSYKHFYSAYGRRQLEDPGLGKLLHPVENDVLTLSMQFAAKQGAPALIMTHAEDGDIVDVYSSQIHASGRSSLDAWSDGRPVIAEVLRIFQAIELARYVGAPLYIPHLTTAEGCRLVDQARRRGDRVYAETGPQWLTHHSGMEEEIGCWGKVNPPLRTPGDMEALWRGLRSGSISCIGTDHGTGGRTRMTKERGGGKHNNIWAARPGIRGGSEHVLPVLLTYGVHRGKIDLRDLVAIGSANAAQIFGLFPNKGALVAGADADILVVDPDRNSVVDDDFYQGLCEVSIYGGHHVRGLVDTTIVRGRVMMEDRLISTDDAGWGRYQPRGPSAGWSTGRKRREVGHPKPAVPQ